LITADATYQTQLDNFKINLGLPPELPVNISDPYLNRFNLLDSDLEAVEDRVNATLTQLRSLRETMQEQGDAGDPAAFDAELNRLIAESAGLQEAVLPRVESVASDLEALDAALPQRRQQLERLNGRPEFQAAQLDPRLFDPAEVDARVAQRRREFDTIKQQIDAIWARFAQVAEGGPIDTATLLPTMIETMANLSGRLLELKLVQAGARLEAIDFQPIELTDEEALLIASAYRRDWQNARASLVDTWRLIFFNANALRSDLDIIFSGDISNVGDNPFNIRDTTGRLRAGIQFDAPLTRLSERNTYRQSLIEYQQARRNYYVFRDGVSQGLRSTLRQVRLNEINFELRRAAVLVAISQVDLTQLRLSEPPPVGVAAAASPTTARDLVQSLSDLLNVQNDFLSVWVNYEVQRMILELDLGVMELDAGGLRRDTGVPFAAYIEGAQRLRDCLCNATDLYPGIGQVMQTAPAAEQFIGESIEPLEGAPAKAPADQESLPLPPQTPPPPATPTPPTGETLINPAADVAPADANGPQALPPVAV
jgi:hypothetical protein